MSIQLSKARRGQRADGRGEQDPWWSGWSGSGLALRSQVSLQQKTGTLDKTRESGLNQEESQSLVTYIEKKMDRKKVVLCHCIILISACSMKPIWGHITWVEIVLTDYRKISSKTCSMACDKLVLCLKDIWAQYLCWSSTQSCSTCAFNPRSEQFKKHESGNFHRFTQGWRREVRPASWV